MRICIDAGHNYSSFDTGAVSNGLREQDITFKIGDKLKGLLTKKGIEVTMTRARETDNVGKNAKDSINERARIANTTKCDLFVSIHCNAGGGTGTEALIFGKGGQAEILANHITKEICEKFGVKNRGVKVRSDLGVLRLTNMPAVLVETAFIDNPADAKLLEFCADGFANAISEGILKHIMGESTEKITLPHKIIEKISQNIEINDKNSAISALSKAKEENSSLYWILYKIAN